MGMRRIIVELGPETARKIATELTHEQWGRLRIGDDTGVLERTSSCARQVADEIVATRSTAYEFDCGAGPTMVRATWHDDGTVEVTWEPVNP